MGAVHCIGPTTLPRVVARANDLMGAVHCIGPTTLPKVVDRAIFRDNFMVNIGHHRIRSGHIKKLEF